MLVQASQDALRHLEIIMVGTKFPENIGMAARACANTAAAPDARQPRVVG